MSDKPHYVITADGKVCAVPAGDGNIDAFLDEYLCGEVGTPTQIVAMSRAQVLARIARSALPTGFPDADVVIGDPSREGGFTRGWLEATVLRWENQELAHQAAETSTPELESNAAEASESAAAPISGESSDAMPAAWAPNTRVWTDVPMSADQWIVLVTSRGIISPSGMVRAGALPDAAALGRFIFWKWTAPGHTKEMPQLWITDEALAGVGLTGEVISEIDEADLPALIGETFGAEITRSRSGWLTAKFSNASGETKTVYLVIIPLMWTDTPKQRPGDMGLAGYEGQETELPSDETEAVHLLADRMAWLAKVGDAGTVPAPTWTTVGAQLLNRIRGGRKTHDIRPCPLPELVRDSLDGELEPNLLRFRAGKTDPETGFTDKMPKRSRDGFFLVTVDQRAAYLASAGQVLLGYGAPREKRVTHKMFEEQKPEFGLYRVNLAPANQFDLDPMLPLPHPHMAWDQPTTFWATTSSISYLMGPREKGGAELGFDELAIDAAYLWPQQQVLLKTWTDKLRVALKEARETGREDYENFIKSIYKSYIGRMEKFPTDWPKSECEHEQPAWSATIRADTRARACRYAARIAADHGLYPGAANVDSWTYRIPAGSDITILNDADSTSNGKYEIERITYGPNGEGPSVESLQQLAQTFSAVGRSERQIAARLGVETSTVAGWLG